MGGCLRWLVAEAGARRAFGRVATGERLGESSLEALGLRFSGEDRGRSGAAEAETRGPAETGRSARAAVDRTAASRSLGGSDDGVGGGVSSPAGLRCKGAMEGAT